LTILQAADRSPHGRYYAGLLGPDDWHQLSEQSTLCVLPVRRHE
jgi:hypothetical protein